MKYIDYVMHDTNWSQKKYVKNIFDINFTKFPHLSLDSFSILPGASYLTVVKQSIFQGQKPVASEKDILRRPWVYIFRTTFKSLCIHIHVILMSLIYSKYNCFCVKWQIETWRDSNNYSCCHLTMVLFLSKHRYGCIEMTQVIEKLMQMMSAALPLQYHWAIASCSLVPM